MKHFLTCNVAIALASQAIAAPADLISRANTTTAASTTASGPSQQPLISGNGQVVVFNSAAPDLVAPSNHRLIDDVFAHDAATKTIERISTRFDGSSGGNGNSSAVQVSKNGRFVLFLSEASDLVANDTNGVTDVFLHDRLTHTTQLISVAVDGTTPANGASLNPSMSADGSRIVFSSFASNLVSNDQNNSRDVFVRDLKLGVTTRVSTDPSGADSLGGLSEAVSISPNGERVAFLTTTTNIVEPAPVEFQPLLVRDLAKGSIIVIPGPPADASPRPKSDSPLPFVVWSEDGIRMVIKYRYLRHLLSFQFGTGTNPIGTLQSASEGGSVIGNWTLSGNGDLAAHSISNRIYLWDFKGPSAPWMHETPDGPPQPTRGWAPMLDHNARQLFLISDANDLDPQSSDSRQRLYSLNLETKQFRSIAPLANVGRSAPPAPFDVSDDGSKVVFESVATDVVPGDRNGFSDVFLADLTVGTITLISRRNGTPAESAPIGQSRIDPYGLSDDGRIALFSSTAADLVPGDLNDAQDIFAVDLDTHAIQAVSRSADGTSMGTHASYSASLSGNGRYASFISASTNLIPNDLYGAIPKLFIRDLVSQSTRFVATNVARLPAASFAGDGSVLVYQSADTDPVVDLYDTALNTVTRLGLGKSRSGEDVIQVSKNGSAVVFFNPGGFYLITRTNGQNFSSSLITFPVTGSFRIGADGKSMIYAGKPAIAPRTQILQSFQTTSPRTLNLAADGSGPAKGESSEPSLDDSGRYLVFTSLATNLVPGTPSFISQVFFRDLQTGAYRLVSTATDGSTPGNRPSRSPSISAEGRYVLFWSLADNLVADDTNGRGDFFVRDLATGVTQIVGRNPASLAVGGSSPTSAYLSRTGGRVVFSTFEESWGTLDLNKTTDIYATQLEPDEDADGMDDRWEKQFFTGSGMGPDEDFDHDGVSNGDEFAANTDPTDPTSFTQLQATRSVAGAVELRWKGEPNRGYRILSSASLSTPAWQLHDFSSLGTGAAMEWSPPADETTDRYYRLLIVR